MTPAKKRKTNEAGSSIHALNNAPKAATLLAQAPAAVRAAITVLANSPVAAPAWQPRQPQPEVVPAPASDPVAVTEPSLEPDVQQETAPATNPDTVPESSPQSEPEGLAAAPAAAPAPRKTKRKKASKRKTLTSKGKRAVVLNVLASVEAQRIAAAAVAAAAAGPPAALIETNTAAADTNTATATTSAAATNVQEQVLPEARKNLGKAWTKEDLAKLARLAEEKDFLLATIPDHPEPTSNGDLDWELISSHFGRYSKGGVAVKQQYYAVVRMMKQARREGKNGSNYVDLVKQALTELPEQRGTVYEIQAILKKGHAKHLDKYKVKGQVRWKKAVGEVLRQETSIFEAMEKTESGKIIWKLK